MFCGLDFKGCSQRDAPKSPKLIPNTRPEIRPKGVAIATFFLTWEAGWKL